MSPLSGFPPSDKVTRRQGWVAISLSVCSLLTAVIALVIK